MPLFSKLFASSKSKAKPNSTKGTTEVYKGFSLTPEPMKEEGGFRIAAKIEKEINGEMKTHQLVRADTLGGLEDAQQASIGKAKVLIDQMGDKLFG